MKYEVGKPYIHDGSAKCPLQASIQPRRPFPRGHRMTPALLPVCCPTWTPRLPSMTVDVRTHLEGVVSSPNSTSKARHAAAADLAMISPRQDFWPAMADVFDEINGGSA